jgi:hypothetical protein
MVSSTRTWQQDDGDKGERTAEMITRVQPRINKPTCRGRAKRKRGRDGPALDCGC